MRQGVYQPNDPKKAERNTGLISLKLIMYGPLKYGPPEAENEKEKQIYKNCSYYCYKPDNPPRIRNNKTKHGTWKTKKECYQCKSYNNGTTPWQQQERDCWQARNN